MATIDDLTTATTALTNAVLIQKATLDTAVANATTQVALATTQAALATTNGAAQVALAATQVAASAANANTVSSVNTVAQTALAGTTSAATQAANARDQANAAWAASMAPAEVLPSISKSIHWGAIVKALIYDTGRDSDGGAWRKRCQDKSWYNEAINGAWLSQMANELTARGDNLVSYPQEFTNAVWNKNATGTGTVPAITANTAVGPDGTVSASTVVFNSGAGITISDQSTLAFAPVVVNGTLYAHTFQVKGTPGDKLVLRGSAGTAYTGFTLDGTWQTLTVKESAISASGNIEIGIRQATAAGTINSSVTVLIASAKVNQVAALASTYSASLENIINGRFEIGATGWVVSQYASTAAVVAGELQVTATAATGSQMQSFPTVVGKTYFVTGDVRKITNPGTTAYITLTNSVGATDAQVLGTNSTTAPKTVSGVFVATATTSYIALRVSTNGDIGAFDNVSVKEVTVVATPYVPYSALVGQYYQNTTDGKYYSLGATYGTQVETFNGNVREHPEQIDIFVETGRVIAYDVTQPGCPMWKVFPIAAGGAFSSVFALNGVINVGCANGLMHYSFLADFIDFRQSGNYRTNGAIATRAISQLVTKPGFNYIISTTVNDVSATVLDAAPVDPATGVKVPTIVVVTAGGVSVIKDDGTVVNSSQTNDTRSCAIVGKTLFLGAKYGATATARFQDLTNLAAGWTPTTSLGFNFGAGAADELKVCPVGPSAYATTFSYNNSVAIIRLNQAVPNASMRVIINSLFNTGWQVGDIRLSALADTVVETVTASGELVTNGIFNTDTSGWTLNTTDGGTAAVSGGAVVITNGASGTSATSLSQVVATVVGRTYQAVASFTKGTAVTGALFAGTAANGSNLGVANLSANGTLSFNFVATATTTYLTLLGNTLAAGVTSTFDNVSCQLASADRCLKNTGLILNGSIVKAAVASGANLVGYSGFSAANYLRQPYTSALDFGTGEWDAGVWAFVPTTFQSSSFPLLTADLLTNGDFGAGSTGWTVTGNDGTHIATFSGGAIRFQSDTTTPVLTVVNALALTAGKSYEITVVISAWTSGSIKSDSFTQTSLLLGGGVGTFKVVGTAQATNFTFTRNSTNVDLTVDSITVRELGQTVLLDRSAATGPSIKLGVNGGGFLVGTAYDGTTTRVVTSPAAVNTGGPTICGMTYRTDGSLALTVNGGEVQRTAGAPLLTMNNANAVLTIGNSFALDAPFPGSLALASISATAPSPDQVAEIYRTELAMMQSGAQCTLDGTSSLVAALAYDDVTDILHAGSVWGRSGMKGLVRIESAATSVGAITSLSANQGAHITGGATAGRYYQPAMLLRDELRRRDVARKALGKVPAPFNFDTISFTATTSITAGVSNQLTGVVVTTGTPYVGMGITGTGIPAGTTITSINGTTFLMSANATAAASGVVMGQSSFSLPKGYTAIAVYSAEALKREGATKTYTRSFDGFVESINFATSPGNAIWVCIMAIRSN